MKAADYVNVTGAEGRYVIERKTAAQPEEPPHKPEEALPLLRDVLETHRLEMDAGALAEDLEGWVRAEHDGFEPQKFGFQEFQEFLNYAQDKLLVRVEPHEERGLMVSLGAEFYPPAPPEPTPEELEAAALTELDEKQPESNQTPALMEKPKRAKRPRRAAPAGTTTRRTRKSVATHSPTPTRARRPRKTVAPPSGE